MTNQLICYLSTTEISYFGIDKLQQLYSFKEPEIVWNFLHKYHFILPILLTAPEKIHQYFPGDRLGLEVHIDPGASENDEELFIIIFTKIECDRAVEKLWELDEDWSLHICREAQHKLEIHLG
ncbi:MAG: hypothetical protein AAGJ08_10990 [Cyanobacteria bacterium P01_H01_bin.35]